MTNSLPCEEKLYFFFSYKFLRAELQGQSVYFVVHGGAVSASPGSLLKMQIFEFHPPTLLNHTLPAF